MNNAAERIVYNDAIDKIFEIKSEIDRLDGEYSKKFHEMMTSIMLFKQDYFAQANNGEREFNAKEVSATEKEIEALYKPEQDEISDKVNSLRIQLGEKIHGIINRLIITNEFLVKLVSKIDGIAWSIVEGSDVWLDMGKRCSLAGLYAVSQNSQFFGKTFSRYQKIRREAYNSHSSQYDAPTNCSAPKDIVNGGGFCILAEAPLDEGIIDQIKQSHRFSKAQYSKAKSETISDYQKALLSVNWFEAYLSRKFGLSPTDGFYGKLTSPVDLKEGNSEFKEIAYRAIDGYIDGLRSTSFILK